MRFTWPWLKEHLETDADLETVTARLSGLGLEVDRVTRRGADLRPFTVALVTSVRRHPEAERLSVCEVDTGTERLQVVCGAPNVHAGMRGVFAPVGVTIPGTGLELRRATIRGVESNGMLCSEAELNLGEDQAGIIELPGDAPVGASAAEVIAVEGPVIDLELTPNRSDCFGVAGIARDLAAAGLGHHRRRSLEPVPPARFEGGIDVTLDFPPGEVAAFPLYVAREFRGLRNGPSPAWLRERLTAIGLRPISALVDITNFVTYDLCRPLHVFDADRLRGDLTIRFARDGEELAALDGRTHGLRYGMTVIADETGPVGLGGIIGGEPSGVTEDTTRVVLEVALFDPVRTAL
ncbi:MAG TPA: phenylalanine--tRNA ligase subunit beta, partial [Geminicoccaceae bacterium]|nr:phenylalanine--tRNA ligase subunit beta [Geminicoccaceae bacterium]